MADLSREEFHGAMASIKELMNARFDGMDDNFARLNGRVGKAEDEVSDLKGDIKVLNASATRGGLQAGGIGAGVVAVLEFVRHWLFKP